MAGDAEFDVIVVGARCAGAPLAADLASRGMRVCLVDRARFPSEVPSTHMLHPCGMARLAGLGLMDALLATDAPPLVQGSFLIEEAHVDMKPEMAARFEAPWLCIRRVVLDQLLVDAAEKAGAHVRTGTAAVGLIEDGGAVCGVETVDGLLRASLVVGADGPNSVVARMVGAREYHVTPPGRLFLWGYFEGSAAPNGYATLGRVGDLGFLAMPTDSGLYMAGIAPPMAERGAYLADTQAGLTGGLNRLGEIGDFVRPATRVGPVRTMARWHGYFRQAAGPGWVLVGDAGHFKDPTPAQGISDALRQGERLAQTIEDGLGAGNLDSRLCEWWRWRDEDAWEMYWFATDMGAAGESPGIVADMMMELGREADGPERLLRVLNHDLAPSQVFTPGRAVRSLVRRSIRRPRTARKLAGEVRTLVGDEMRRRRLARRTPFQTAERHASDRRPTGGVVDEQRDAFSI